MSYEIIFGVDSEIAVGVKQPFYYGKEIKSFLNKDCCLPTCNNR